MIPAEPGSFNRASLMSSHWIAIDWGSTNARALLFDRDGNVVDSAEHPLGIKHLAAGEHAAAFERMAGEWRRHHGPIPALLSGMIGSRHGWVEVPYLTCPVALTELAGHLLAVPQVPDVFIVPGVKMDADRPDVIRGEELQVLGLGAAAMEFDFVCIPGTHSKWIRTEGRTLHEFWTAMTGEVFAVITSHTLFSQLIPTESHGAPLRAAAFRQGIERSAAPHGLLHALFELRAALLLGRIESTDLGDLISGLLIGTELRHVQVRARPGSRIAILGTPALNERYATALQFFALEPIPVNAVDVAARGFVALHAQITARHPLAAS